MLRILKRCTCLINKNHPFAYNLQNVAKLNIKAVPKLLQVNQPSITWVRWKKKAKSKDESSDISEESDQFEDAISDKNSKVIKFATTSLRIDSILKMALGISRNKVEVLFYESKLRLNGGKILKKSINVQEGDEIDIIKGVNFNNPDLLTVARVEVLSLSVKDESYQVKARRCKSLIVENYKDKWNAS